MTRRPLALILAAFLAVTLPACARLDNHRTDVQIHLSSSPTAAEFERQVPGTFVFADRMGAALVALLPTPLKVDGANAMTRYRAGDVAYWADEQSLFVFRTDGESVPGAGLVLVGHVTGGTAALAHCTQNCALRVSASGLLEDGTDQ